MFVMAGRQAPEHQFVFAGDEPTVDELGENVGGPRQGIDDIEFAEKRCDHAPIVTRHDRGRRTVRLSSSGQAADRTLDGVVVYLDAGVFEEAAQAVPMVEAIGI
jgi:hypothetical protein